MSSKPFFSIIVPVFQSESFLRKTVEKLKNQTFSDIEIILVDDGSTDQSPRICDELAGNNNRIISLHKENGGASSARNTGIEASTGDWIIFVDSDDTVSEVMCENFFSYISKYKNIDFVTANFATEKEDLVEKVSTSNVIYSVNNNNQCIDLVKQMLLSKYDNLPNSFRKSFGSNIVLNSPCGKAYRKKFLSENNLYFHENIVYSEDLLFNIEVLIENARGIFINDSIYFYYQNVNSVSHAKYMPDLIKNYCSFKKIVDNLLKKEGVYNLESVLGAYVFKMALGVISSNIFVSNLTYLESSRRLKKILSSKEFISICNWNEFKDYKKYFDFPTKVKAWVLLKGNFFLLLLLYKMMRLFKSFKKGEI